MKTNRKIIKRTKTTITMIAEADVDVAVEQEIVEQITTMTAKTMAKEITTAAVVAVVANHAAARRVDAVASHVAVTIMTAVCITCITSNIINVLVHVHLHAVANAHARRCLVGPANAFRRVAVVDMDAWILSVVVVVDVVAVLHRMGVVDGVVLAVVVVTTATFLYLKKKVSTLISSLIKTTRFRYFCF